MCGTAFRLAREARRVPLKALQITTTARRVPGGRWEWYYGTSRRSRKEVAANPSLQGGRGLGHLLWSVVSVVSRIEPTTALVPGPERRARVPRPAPSAGDQQGDGGRAEKAEGGRKHRWREPVSEGRREEKKKGKRRERRTGQTTEAGGAGASKPQGGSYMSMTTGAMSRGFSALDAPPPPPAVRAFFADGTSLDADCSSRCTSGVTA